MRTHVDETIPMSCDPTGDPAPGAAPLTVEVASELTEGHGVGRTIRTLAYELAAVEAADGAAIVFSVDSDRRLIVIHGSGDGSASGRTQRRIGAELGPVSAFGVGQSARGDYVLAVAVEDARTPGQTAVYLTSPLPNELARVDWGALAWTRRGGKAGVVATRILVGEEPVDPDDPRSGPLVVLFTEERGEAKHYAIDADTRKPEAAWGPLHLRENVERVVDVTVGESEDGPAVYALCEQLGTLRLIFAPADRRAPHAVLPVPAGLRARRDVLAVRHVGRGRTELYLAGDGLFLLPPDRQHSRIGPGDFDIVVPAAEVRGAHDLVVRADDAEIALWALDEQDRLFEVTAKTRGERATPVAWSPAVRLRTGVRRLAPLRNRRLGADSLLTLSADRVLEHWTMSPTSECWTKREIAVDDPQETVRFDCYASTVTLRHADGTPFDPKRPLRLSSNEWTEVIVNGTTHEVRPGVDVEVHADERGCVTVYTKVQGLASPIFTLRGEGLSEPVTIVPGAKVWKGLAAVGGAGDLKKVTFEDGSRLIDARVSDNDVEVVAKCLPQVEKMRKLLPQDGSVSGRYLAGVADVGEVAWGMSLDAGGLRFREGEAALAHMSAALLEVDVSRYAAEVDPGDVFSRSIGETAGRIFEWFRSKAEAFFDFVVRRLGDAFQFVVRIGSQAFHFVVKTLTHLYELGQAVLEQVGVGLAKLQRWLGFLFSWEDIRVTHSVLLNVCNQVIARGKDELTRVEGRVATFFDDLIEKARALDDANIDHRAARAPSGRARDELPGEIREKAEAGTGFAKSPQGGFLGYHLCHSARVAGDGAVAVSMASFVSDEGRSLVEGVIEDVRSVIAPVAKWVEDVGADLTRALRQGTVSLNDLLRRIGARTLVAVLEVVKAVVVKVLRMGARLVQVGQDLLNAELPIPFLSPLYERLVGGKATLLGVMTLAVSIPATTLYKLLAGEAPFPFVDEQALLASGADVAMLSPDPRYAGLSRKPRTYGLESLVGVAFWTLLSAAVGGGGGIAYLASKTVQKLVTTVNAALNSANGLKLVAGIGLVWQVVRMLGTAIWLSVKVPEALRAIEDLRFARFLGTGTYLVGAIVNCFDLSGRTGGFFYVMGSLVDLVLLVPFTVVRIGYDAAQGDGWLVAASVVAAGNSVVAAFGNVCWSGAPWFGPKVGAVLAALGIGATIWSGGVTVVLSATPFATGKMYEWLG